VVVRFDATSLRASLPPQACLTVFAGSALPVPVRALVFTERRSASALFLLGLLRLRLHPLRISTGGGC